LISEPFLLLAGKTTKTTKLQSLHTIVSVVRGRDGRQRRVGGGVQGGAQQGQPR
jgi:hypothetical protein